MNYRLFLGLFFLLITSFAHAAKDNFILTSDMPYVQIIQGNTTTVTYLVKNNTPYNLTSLGFIKLPKGITHSGGSCTPRSFSLNANATCEAIFTIDSNVMSLGTVVAGPELCHTIDNPMQCSKPDSNAVPNQVLHVNVVSANSPNLPQLELIAPAGSGYCDTAAVPDCYIFLSFEDTLTVQVRNLSTTQAAYDVQIRTQFLNLSSVNPPTCGNINPNSTCTVTFTAASPSMDGSVSFYSTINVPEPLNLNLDVDTQAIELSMVMFYEPGTTNLILSNRTTLPVTVTGVTITGSVFGVTPDFTSCALAGEIGATCNIPIDATVNAYGSGDINVTYTVEGIPDSFVAMGTVNVNSVSILINDGNPVVFYQLDTTPELIDVYNMGEFTLQNLQASLNATNIGDRLTLNANTCGSTLGPLTTCKVQLTNNGLTTDDIGQTALIEINGTNITTSPTEKNVAISPGITIAAVIENDDVVGSVGQHMQYQAFAIGNTFDETLTLDIDIALDSSLDSKIHICQPNDANCDGYASPSVSQAPICTTPSMELATNTFCVVWLKALDTQLGLSETDVAVGVTFTVTVDIPSQNVFEAQFPIDHAVSLYAGGYFGDAVASCMDAQKRVVRWTGGSTWTCMNTNGFELYNGVGEIIFGAMDVYKGDLYVTGIFSYYNDSTLVASTVASWNGSDWLGVGSPQPFSDSATAPRGEGMLVYEDKLYVSGRITKLVEENVPAAGIVYWDGTNWNPMPATGAQLPTRDIDAPTVYNNEVCVGLINDTTTNDDNVYCFNGTSWSTLPPSGAVFSGGSASGLIRDLVVFNGNLYAIGEFTTVTQNSTTTNGFGGFAVYNPSSSAWTIAVDSLGRGLNSFRNTTGIVYNYPSTETLMVGGIFSSTNTNTVNPNPPSNTTLNGVGQYFGTTSPWGQLTNINNTGIGVAGTPPDCTGDNNTAWRFAIGYNSAGDESVLYVGGAFNEIGGIVQGINGAYWDGSLPTTTNRWQPLPEVMLGTVNPDFNHQCDIRALKVAPSLLVGNVIP